MKYFCNPLNVEYRYQFHVDPEKGGEIQVAREAADPSMILFEGKYYIFASMTLGVWVSKDLVHWDNHRLPKELPLYDYAPDVRVVGDYVYFSASKRGEICHFYRTKDIINGPYEEIPGSFDFWDPNLFRDDDGRLYFYWGCTNTDPIWGVELDSVSMKPLCERKGLIYGDMVAKGYERGGEEHSKRPLDEAGKRARDEQIERILEERGIKREETEDEIINMLCGYLSPEPYIEGPWMNKFGGKYYLQYACPGTEYNIYCDGVYVADNPLGPFELAQNNPYSYKPGGFLPGAGHGSTMEDLHGNLWHTATMRISMNHKFERRIGLWPAGIDEEGELFCNQRYGDWPMAVALLKMDPWKAPEWFLLSYGAKASASSAEDGKGPELAVDENVQTWWRATGSEPGEWLQVDLGCEVDVRAVQINFADDKIQIDIPGKTRGVLQPRYIEEEKLHTRWILEGSRDGAEWFLLEDKSQADTSLAHDLVVKEKGVWLRYVKLTVLEIPYDQKPCVSGVRVFGIGKEEKPGVPEYLVETVSDIDKKIRITAAAEGGHPTGYNILWGHGAERLYHSYMVFIPVLEHSAQEVGEVEQTIGALVSGRDYFVRVDAFNGAGITEGVVKRL